MVNRDAVDSVPCPDVKCLFQNRFPLEEPPIEAQPINGTPAINGDNELKLNRVALLDADDHIGCDRIIPNACRRAIYWSH